MSTPTEETDHPLDGPIDGRTDMATDGTAPESLVPDDAPRASGRPGARRTALVMIPLLAGLGVTAAVGGQMLWAEIEDPQPASTGLVCWNGDDATTTSDCPKPRGVDGMAWVLPSFRPDRLDCVDELELHPEYNRPVMWTCDQVVDGQSVSVTYSQVTGQRAALRYFDKLHGDTRVASRSSDGRSEIFSWAPSGTPDGTWTASLLLRDAPYAVSVVAPTSDAATTVLERRVRIRPPGARRAVEAS